MLILAHLNTLAYQLVAAMTAASSTAQAITLDEPPTLQLALIGVGTLAAYGVLFGWRPRRAAIVVDLMAQDGNADDIGPVPESPGNAIKRAA